jgi:hypothetical protein
VRVSADPVGIQDRLQPQIRGPSHPAQGEAVDSGPPHRYSISNRERSTLPPPPDHPTLLPLTLETFSSVSASAAHGSYGSIYSLHDSHGQSHDAVEHETLVRTRNKPRPSSTRITFHNNQASSSSSSSSSSSTFAGSSTLPTTSSSLILRGSSSNNNNQNNHNNIHTTNSLTSSSISGSSSSTISLDSTEEPPKISTFMYVDEDSDKQKKKNKPFHSSSNNLIISNNKFINNVRVDDSNSKERVTPAIEEKTLLPSYSHEDLNSNTENIWSVVMQLGSSGGVGGTSPSLLNDRVDDNVHSLEEAELTKIEDLSHSLTGGVDKLEDLSGTTVSNAYFGGEIGSPKPTAGGLMLDSTFLKLKTDSDEGSTMITTTGGTKEKFGDEFENDITTEQENSSGGSSTGGSELEESKTTARPWASSTYFVHTFRYPNVTGSIPDSTGSSTSDEDSVQLLGSSTLPSIGKITTWSGIGSVVDKDQLFSKQSESDENDDKPLSNFLITKGTTITTTTEVATEATTPMTTTTTTTTRRPTTRYTTRRTTSSTTTTTTTTTEKPESTTEAAATTSTEKWKKPKPYTLPPHKRPTTPEPTTPKTERITKKTTTTTTTTTKKPKIITKKPVSSIILEEELDSNLDDFVEQVSTQ